jgi:hypothetical protein
MNIVIVFSQLKNDRPVYNRLYTVQALLVIEMVSGRRTGASSATHVSLSSETVCSCIMVSVIHNSLTHFVQLVSLNGGKDCNMQPTDAKTNSPSLFRMLRKCFMCVRRDTPDVKPIIHFRPFQLQHVTIDFWDGSDDLSSQHRQILWWTR